MTHTHEDRYEIDEAGCDWCGVNPVDWGNAPLRVDDRLVFLCWGCAGGIDRA